MARATVTPDDRERYARARRRGHQHSLRPHAIVSARYDPTHDLVELTLRNGEVRAIPRDWIPELAGIPRGRLRHVSVSPAGDAISWRALNVDVNVETVFRRGVQSDTVSPPPTRTGK